MSEIKSSSNATLATQGESRETLARGASILNKIAMAGVVKEETPQDERDILLQIKDCMLNIACAAWTVFRSMGYTSTQELQLRMAKMQELKACVHVIQISKPVLLYKRTKPVSARSPRSWMGPFLRSF